MRRELIAGMLAVALLLAGCSAAAPDAAVGTPPDASFGMRSPAFAHEGAIPAVFTCDGEDISPPLEWDAPPSGTQGLALICDDPDAPVGTWVHWVLYDIPADARSLAEAVPPQETLTDGSRHGQNSWRRTDYGGPCPPSGTHHYSFRLYALDTTLELGSGATKNELLATMEGHILAQAELVGTYKR